MTRRQLAQKIAGGIASVLTAPRSSPGADSSDSGQAATEYVADFIVKTSLVNIPAQALEFSRKSTLGGLGLALSGSVAEAGEIVRKYLESTGLTARSGAVVIGSSLKAPIRFAAFANGVGIHAADYDDTQLAVEKDRVYGLLTHPTASVLPAALAAAENRALSGHDLLLAYNTGVEIETKICEAMAPRHYEEGFHSTAL